jgi:6-phosphofructokinase 1
MNSTKKNYKWSIGSTNLDNVANVEKMLPKFLLNLMDLKLLNHVNNIFQILFKGKITLAYKNGFPKYAKLECKTIKKKLASYKL